MYLLVHPSSRYPACGAYDQTYWTVTSIGNMWAHQAVAATPSSGYSVAKAGPHALTRNLAIELAPHRIRVNAVAPTVVKTWRAVSPT